MQLTTVVVGTLAALASSVSAAKVSVHNKCEFPVYVLITPNNNAGPEVGPIRLPARDGVWSSPYQMPAGAAVKLARSKNGFATPLTMEYTPSNDLVYYDISNNSGNPFAEYRNKLIPNNPKCYTFNCAPNDADCYSNGITPMVKTCPTANLKTVLCATA